MSGDDPAFGLFAALNDGTVLTLESVDQDCAGDNKETLKFINDLESRGVQPCGLGSRDTLRLEASLPLYGFELTDDITPVEAGLKWTLSNKSDYIGKNVIDEQLNSKNHKY